MDFSNFVATYGQSDFTMNGQMQNVINFALSDKEILHLEKVALEDRLKKANATSVALNSRLSTPGRPEDAGITMDVLRRFGPEMPILGVCLGHQAIGMAYGGIVCRAVAPHAR